ncbi:MAG: aminotransferase class I/II-fold pyridoxal phosphate-dependent enzyme [Lachnospiraceae bacterium]|nr:aminotransferase class I/II-fold pyridoxal phosphate-dependent enzyme [Lachnospiraceae bacterium]
MGIHGGNVYRNHVDIDFSINVNPLGIPESVKTALHRAVEMCDKYPDIEAEKLKKTVGEFLAVPGEYLLFGNGASELFMAIVHGIKPKKIVIPVPSFYGYEYAAKTVDSEIIYYEMKKENNFCMTEEIDNILTNNVDLLFFANPNNPVGNLLSKERLKGLLQHCENRGIYVVLDECFIEFCGERFSMISEIEEFPHLILVRAFTKIFAIPGVRLGYLVCKNKPVLTKIAGQLPEWNLSCFAHEAGCICAEQSEFIMKTEIFVKKEREFMVEELGRKGFRIFPSMANFILIHSEENLYERLLEKGILIRDCRNFRGLGKGFYRVAVKRREENEILLKNL